MERGETIFQSARREILEEAGIVAEDEPILKGFCLNDAQFPGDHVAIMVVQKYRQMPWKPSLEISHTEFFAQNELPADTTGGTRRRIAELSSNGIIAANW